MKKKIAPENGGFSSILRYKHKQKKTEFANNREKNWNHVNKQNNFF